MINKTVSLEEASQLYKENNVMPEFGIYYISYLYNLRYLIRRGFFELPLQMNFVLGVLGGIGGNVRVGSEDNILISRDVLAKSNA